MPDDPRAASEPSGTSERPMPLGRLDALPRQGPETLNGYLCTVGQTATIDGVRTRMRTHLVPHDVNGVLQTGKLATLLADLVTDYCIPRDQREHAFEQSRELQSHEPVNALRREAVELFVNNETSGEAGEMLLYLLTERVLGAPQIISKMALKTSSAMHYHGADGVHAKRTENGLALFWGESKIHEDRTAAVRECLRSVEPFLTDPNRETARRDLQLVRNNLDVEGKDLRDAMVRFFIQRNPEWNRLEFRASCLVGFNLDNYPKYTEDATEALEPEVDTMINDWLGHVKTRITAEKLESFDIDIFMIPFPNVSTFRTEMLRALGVR